MLINDLSARIHAHRAKVRAAMDQVLDSGWVVLGPQVRQFESAFARYIGVSHCIGLANGTDAIELALRALNVQPRDSVATVANAGMYSTIAARAAGAEPLFMDVDETSRNASLAEVHRALEAGAKAVVLTHLYGQPVADTVAIARACSSAGVPLVEDCAQAHGATVDGRRVGSFGDAAAFSFYPTKNLGALGDGGAVGTNSSEIADQVRRLRQYGWTDKYKVEFAGARNSRLDEMQAAVLAAFLPDLDAANGRRMEIARMYSDRIRHPEVALPAWADGSVAHLYVVCSGRRESLRRHLKDLDIATDVHYPVPDHRQPVFGDRFADVRLPVTERLSTQVLTLPCYPEMTDDDVRRVADAVNTWAGDAGAA